MHVTIHTAAIPDGEVHISNSAAKLVRMISKTAADLVRTAFDPRSLDNVERIKALAAALISECEAIRDKKGPGAREAAIAITDTQKASMMAVAAATAHM